LLVAPGDLPRINAAAVRGVALRDRRLPSIDIAPTQDGGTGFLLLTPPDAIAPCFGPNSFRRHTLLAELRTVAVHEVTDEAFTFDLDTPEDLNLALPYLRGVLST
jgi:2-phospho-L-lactate guanylyltransferase